MIRVSSGVLGCLASAVFWVVGQARAVEDVGSQDVDAEMRQRIRSMQEGVRDVPLPVIVEALSGRHVIPWDGHDLEPLSAAALAIRDSINHDGIVAARINEAGNQAEGHVLEGLRGQGFEVRRPVAPSGHARSAGYPDLEAGRGGNAYYVEVKVFSAGTETSTQRSFYLSPSTDFKVTHDACHLLVAIELTRDGDGRYRAVHVRWLDLSRLRCDLKYEFNASNRDLYAPDAGLIIIEPTLEPRRDE